MSERERILDELRRAWDGDPWHGSPFADVLDGLTADEAAARPVANAHSAWEIVLHARSWTREVARRLGDGEAGEPVDGDWPAVGETTEEAWSAAVASLAAAHGELLSVVASFPESRLDEPVGDSRNPALGAGVSYAVMLHGLAQHHAYHAGQIALLRKSFAPV
jgi:hypothetical protein